MDELTLEYQYWFLLYNSNKSYSVLRLYVCTKRKIIVWIKKRTFTMKIIEN
ncbi:hypothetical protein RchiOBHm_Chr1g0348491 [Rosa chinensis]|uniref:Uncharacterized protein n=1 Tax=Rosa chinensis TaxID=74649 RepID=A0A2P6SFJ6_ROSCH|nr:hypothetical protein RchiOBHm_Chr1g0348491 [Rosa chinensis]